MRGDAELDAFFQVLYSYELLNLVPQKLTKILNLNDFDHLSLHALLFQTFLPVKN